MAPYSTIPSKSHVLDFEPNVTDSRVAQGASVSDKLAVLWLLWSVSAAVLIARRGYKKRSLTFPGAVAAMVVGFIHMECGLQYGVVLIMFYMTSSKLTKVKANVKRKLQEAHDADGRGAGQVLSNSLGGCVFALLAAILQLNYPLLSRCCQAAFLAHYACCCGDTWASEVGILSKRSPRLITTLKTVPPGTNGGVSFLGLASSAAAGLLIGITFISSSIIVQQIFLILGGKPEHLHTPGNANDITHLISSIQHNLTPLWVLMQARPPSHNQAWMELAQLGHSMWQHVKHMTGIRPGSADARYTPCVLTSAFWVPASVVIAVAGSAVDSLLGATVQYSGFDEEGKVVVSHVGPHVKHISGVDILSNTWVNFVSAMICSIGTALTAYYAASMLS